MEETLMSLYTSPLLLCTIATETETVFVGSLNFDSSIVAEDATYILATHMIPCNGTVIAWEFCYQISSETSVTFYPGIWMLTDVENNGDANYELFQSNNVTFDPRHSSCQIFNLSVADQFITPMGSFIGLYSNTGEVRPKLLRTDDMNSSITTFQVDGNDRSVTNVKPDKKDEDFNYNIAIRVHLGKYVRIMTDDKHCNIINMITACINK